MLRRVLAGLALSACGGGVEGQSLDTSRLDEGTRTLRLSARAEPPVVVYRDAGGGLLEASDRALGG